MSNIYSYQCIGLISGSSLDGLDIALVQMDIDPSSANPVIDWSIRDATTIPYPESLIKELQTLPHASAIKMVEMDNLLGKHYGDCVNTFITDNGKIDFVSSHGHTIFHHPGQSSTQIGNPAIIAATTGIQTIGHLRNMDTAYGGQGAPLAPMADLYLLPDHDICVNLGGIANISIKTEAGIIGFDVCGANQFLNHLVQSIGLDYDDGGQLARSGQIDTQLLTQFNDISYCHQAIPKSLDNEQVRAMYLPILDHSEASIIDKLATMVEHIAVQLSQYSDSKYRSMHLAGGGTLNTFLVERIAAQLSPSINLVVPSEDIINFKEAVLIAMCGALRLHGLPNSLKTITGASKNTINGVVFLP